MFLTAGGCPPGTNPPQASTLTAGAVLHGSRYDGFAWLANAARLQLQNNGIRMTQTYGIRDTAAHPKQRRVMLSASV